MESQSAPEKFTISRRGRSGKLNVVKEMQKCKAISLIQWKSDNPNENGLWRVAILTIGGAGQVTNVEYSELNDKRNAIFNFRALAAKNFMSNE